MYLIRKSLKSVFQQLTHSQQQLLGLMQYKVTSYPGDSDNGQYISFTERQVLFVGSLEVVLGYTLCATRPWCLHHTGQRGRSIDHSVVAGGGTHNVNTCVSVPRQLVALIVSQSKYCKNGSYTPKM